MWDEVASDSGNCLGRNCPTYKKCFYFHARRRVQNAQILVVNHALFFSDLALRRQGVSILPDYDVVIFDEAHTIEAVAGDHLGLGVTRGQVEYVARTSSTTIARNKGLLVHHNRCRQRSQLVDRCRDRADEFFADRSANGSTHGRNGNGRVREAEIVPNALSPALLRDSPRP